MQKGKYLLPSLLATSLLLFSFSTQNLSSVKNLIRVPLTRQSTDYTCGVAAVQSVMAYYGYDIREDNLAKALKVSSESGTDYNNIESYAKSQGFSVVIQKEMNLDALKEFIKKGKPVICAIQAWSDNPGNYKDDWDDGHYVVAIGYDSDRIYFMDPSTLGNYTYIPTEEFLKRWHDIDQRGIKLIHFGIVISKDKPEYTPNIIKYLE